MRGLLLNRKGRQFWQPSSGDSSPRQIPILCSVLSTVKCSASKLQLSVSFCIRLFDKDKELILMCLDKAILNKLFWKLEC